MPNQQYHMLHVAISSPDMVDWDRAKPVLDKAKDWAHYLPGAVMIYTRKDASWWYDRLRAVLPDGMRFFVSEVDLSDRQGWLPKWAWDWIKEKAPAERAPADRPVLLVDRR